MRGAGCAGCPDRAWRWRARIGALTLLAATLAGLAGCAGRARERTVGSSDPACRSHRDGEMLVLIPTAAEIRRSITLADWLGRHHPELVVRRGGPPGTGVGLRGRNPAVRPSSQTPILLMNDILISAPGGAALDPLGEVRLSDVARVELLRGSAAAAMYGTGGAAGVLRVYTIEGGKAVSACTAAEVP